MYNRCGRCENLTQVVRRPRHSDPWFDGECRHAKRVGRRHERRYASVCRRAADDAEVNAAKTAWYDQRRAYRQLRKRKCTAFWSEQIDTDRADPRKLRRSVDVLLGRGHTSAAPSIHADEFCRFFSEKVAKIRAATDGAPSPCFSSVCSGVSLHTFTSVSANDVVDAIPRLPDQCSAADPIPTYVMKRISDIIAPFVAELFNRSLVSGRFPAGFKEASITPVIKSRVSTPPTPLRIDPFPTCRYYLNCSNGSWCVS